MGFILSIIIEPLHMILMVYSWVIIIAVLLSWVRPDPNNPIVQILYRLAFPLLHFVRRKCPFLVINGIDLSPLVVIILLQVLDRALLLLLSPRMLALY